MNDFHEAYQEAVACHGRFGHAAHVQVAWTLLERLPALEGLAQFRAGLRQLAQGHGQPEKYHETLTIAFMVLILDRRWRSPVGTWAEFAAANPDLLTRTAEHDVLGAYYPGDLLASPEARARFVAPLPSAAR